MKIKKLDNYDKYKALQDPKTRDYNMSLVSIEDIEPYLGASVLDIGCKAGKLVSDLHDRGIDAWGIDIGEGCQEVWDEKLNLICDDFTHYKFDRKFDLVVMSHVLEHFYAPATAMREVHRLTDLVYCTFPINDRYGAHYFSFDNEDEIIPWFDGVGFKAEIINIDMGDTYPIFTVILTK